MDLQLRWIYDMDWVDINQLPPEMAKALAESIQKHGITLKRIGIIHDGMPNAFTYGRFKSDARIVFTEGIIDILDPEERVAVLEHEVGHIAHLDFVFMTLAAAVPLLFYYTYITLRRISANMSSKRSGSNSKGGNAAALFIAAAVLAWLLYRLSNLAVLLLSRYREHYADEFSAFETRKPGFLSSALVKISYGMVVADANTKQALESDDTPDDRKRELRRRSGYSHAIRTMGIADVNTAKGLVMQAAVETEEITAEDVAAAASWDLQTPWATFIELQSTHPLTGKRLKALDGFAEQMGQPPKYPLLGKVKPPESLLDEFLVDLSMIYLVPWSILLLPIIGLLVGVASGLSAGVGLGSGLILAAMAWLYRVSIKYPRSIHEYDDSQRKSNTVLEALTSMERDGYYEASPVRGKPIKITGIVKGRGTPGFILAEDFMVQDKTGFIVIDFNSVIPFYNLWFGYKKIKEMWGQEVTVVGWYHRSIRPYITLFRVYRKDGDSHRNRWRGANLVFAAFLAFIGALLMLGIFGF
jgi:Zn-dependent protease with chaperone function